VDRLLYTAAALLIFAGAVCTLRRSGVILPFVACSAVLVLGGRRMLPRLAVFAVMLALVPLVAPGAVRDVVDQFSATNQTAQQSIAGRTSDYEATAPDVRAGALLGRGFGTYDSKVYRFLDNEYITLTIETGFLGLAAYLAAILAAIGMALRARSRSDPEQGWIALAGVGSGLAFLFANAFFDTLAFPHAPYGFLLVVALVAVSRRAPAVVAEKV
jgi:O-antigen ligase